MKSIITAASLATVLVAAAPLEPRADITYLPTALSQYTYSTGAVQYNTNQGLVDRYPSNGGKDISTLLTFQIPASYANYQCQLVFDLTQPGASASGSRKAQIFSSIKPAAVSSPQWPSGNLRDQNPGTIQVAQGSRATWEAGSGPGATNNGAFPCSTIAGKVVGYEVAPQGDTDHITWASNDGLKIIVHA